ncbi:glycosyl transferase [Burkholderia sp. SRS-W-2-2016]|uniref:glycosyltransferase n=1 Tax=Burkholderia sp. SRS-W-2-2016 TaxID=1926878 RepID=UPI00094AD01C|nr:glycosyltransferase [Burkholderia sp. SRS-W-2-2016]OLL31192.1 glycosyl transferase [Burkholderia sp. SRS-W-2-2016]
MRVVHITEAFGGGVLSMLTELCNRTAATGAKVTVLFSMRPETPKNFRELFHPDVDLVYVSMCREVHPRKDWLSMWEMAAHIRRCDPTVIHLHSSKASVLGRAAARVATQHAKIFYSPHGLAFLRSDVSRAKQLAFLTFERVAALMGGTVVACSPGELNEIKGGMHVKDAALIENGVNIESIPVRQVREDTDIVIGMNGRASFQKHHEMFIALANTLHDSSTRFLWIGGNRDDLKDERETPALTCSGWLTRSRALELVSGLDIYVQTSRWEGMPVALIEAQVAGIPAVVTDVVGNRDVVVHGVTGFVASTQEQMARYLTDLREDRQLREKMGNAARELAIAKFSMDTIFCSWLSLYETAKENPGKGTRERLAATPREVQANPDQTV